MQGVEELAKTSYSREFQENQMPFKTNIFRAKKDHLKSKTKQI